MNEDRIIVPRFDNFSTDNKASKILSTVKSKDTKPELLFRKSLWHMGLRYQKNVKNLPGKPDIVFSRRKTVVFIDGDFWHGKNWMQKKDKIKRNRDYWINKIERNIQRDYDQTQQLSEMGWFVIRFWESDVIHNLKYCIEFVVDHLRNNH